MTNQPSVSQFVHSGRSTCFYQQILALLVKTRHFKFTSSLRFLFTMTRKATRDHFSLQLNFKTPHVHDCGLKSVPGCKNLWSFTDYQLLDNISKGLSTPNTQSQSISSSVTVAMGVPVTIMAVFLVLLATGVQTLNPDDPNVCSHWERWVQTSHEGQFEC